jgi:hypothetical protein
VRLGLGRIDPSIQRPEGLVLERLDEVAAEADGHRGADQPLRRELL